MSDLFAPMPLPDRPVLQLADIAEREAAAKQKEIDTRMRERTETSRMQAIHEIGVSKEAYQRSLQELEQEYRKKALQEQPRSYASGSSSRGRQLYQAQSRGSVDLERQLYNQENGRLNAQVNRAKVMLRMLVNNHSRSWMEERWSDDEGWDKWQEEVTGIMDSMRYHPDSQLFGTVTTKYQMEINDFLTTSELRMVDDLSNHRSAISGEMLEFQTSRNLQDVLNEFEATSDTHMLDQDNPDILGVGYQLSEVPSWNAFMEIATSSITEGILDGDFLNKGKPIYRMVKRALIGRFGRAAALEFSSSLTFAQSDQVAAYLPHATHMHNAVATVLDSPLYRDPSVGRYEITQKDIRTELEGRAAVVLSNRKAANEVGLIEFYGDGVAGLHQTMAPEDYYYALTSFGVLPREALRQAKAHGVEQGNTGWLEFKQTREDIEEDTERRQSLYMARVGLQMQLNPQWMDNINDLKVEFLRLETNGSLPVGSGDHMLKTWGDKDNRAVLELYAPVFDSIRGWGRAIGDDENTRDNEDLPMMISDQSRGQYVASWENDFSATLTDLIVNPKDGKPRPTVEAAQEIMDRLMLQASASMDLTKDTTRRLGSLTATPHPSQEALPTGMGYRIQPIFGAERLFSHKLIQSVGASSDILEEYDALPSSQQARFAIRQIGLQGFDGTSADDDAQAAMEAILGDLQGQAIVRKWSIDRAGRKAYVQLADNAEVHFIDLDRANAVQMRGAIYDDALVLAELATTIDQGLSMGNAKLSYVHVNDQTGEVTEHKTAVVDILIRKASNLINKINRAGRSMSDYGGIDWFAAGEMAGLRPWHTE